MESIMALIEWNRLDETDRWIDRTTSAQTIFNEKKMESLELIGKIDRMDQLDEINRWVDWKVKESIG